MTAVRPAPTAVTPPVSGHVTPAAPSSSSSWSAYAAAAAALSFAGVSFYWAAGGLTGVSTLGGDFEELALARDPTLITIVWVTGVLKVAVGILALALVRPWGRRLPRRWLVRAAWVCAGFLTIYGALQLAGVALAALGVVDTTSSDSVLLWRLLLWEPWFLVWGLLLGLAARYAHKRPDLAC